MMVIQGGVPALELLGVVREELELIKENSRSDSLVIGRGLRLKGQTLFLFSITCFTDEVRTEVSLLFCPDYLQSSGQSEFAIYPILILDFLNELYLFRLPADPCFSNFRFSSFNFSSIFSAFFKLSLVSHIVCYASSYTSFSFLYPSTTFQVLFLVDSPKKKSQALTARSCIHFFSFSTAVNEEKSS